MYKPETHKQMTTEETLAFIQGISSDRLIEIIKLKQINAELLDVAKRFSKIIEMSPSYMGTSILNDTKQAIAKAEGKQ